MVMRLFFYSQRQIDAAGNEEDAQKEDVKFRLMQDK
jgi:hypothetical protein